MKKLFFLCLVFLFLSCTDQHETKPPFSDGRFVIIYEQSFFDGGAQLLLDTISGQKYLFYKYGYAGGLTKL